MNYLMTSNCAVAPHRIHTLCPTTTTAEIQIADTQELDSRYNMKKSKATSCTRLKANQSKDKPNQSPAFCYYNSPQEMHQRCMLIVNECPVPV